MLSDSDSSDSNNVNETAGGAGPSHQKVLSASSSSSSSSQSLSSSSSSEQETMEKIRSSAQQAPSVDKSECPQCEKKFSSSSSVRRHMRSSHSLSSDAVAEIPIRSVKHPCPHCGNMYSNLSKHYSHCKHNK